MLPSEIERRSLISSGSHLVHYTNHAVDILKSNELRLRNARKMTDQNEIRIGRECVDQFLGEGNTKFSDALDRIRPRLFARIKQTWDTECSAQIDQTFIACFTVQSSDDILGNEYHWNNFGRTALCLNPAFLVGEPSLLSLYLVKVNYGKEAILDSLSQMTEVICSHESVFRSLPENVFLSFVGHALYFASVASKSSDFSPENEWRLIHSPFLFSSAHLLPEYRTYSNSNELVYLLQMTIPLGTTLAGLATSNLIRKVLIKRDQPSWQDRQADIISQLKYHGATDARDRVLIVD